jgi:hypothetical protein
LKESTTFSSDRRLVSHLAGLEPQDRADILAQLGEDEALRDVGADLTIDRVRDVLEYAPTAKLAQQIRNALARALEGEGWQMETTKSLSGPKASKAPAGGGTRRGRGT